jgi:hypothetical protein
MRKDVFDALGQKFVRVPAGLLREMESSRTASGGDSTKNLIVERAARVKSERVKKYVRDGLLKKIDQAGDAAGAWLEKLESDFDKLKPKGLMEEFEQKDFDDLWFVLIGQKRKKGSSEMSRIAAIAQSVAGLTASRMGFTVVSVGPSIVRLEGGSYPFEGYDQRDKLQRQGSVSLTPAIRDFDAKLREIGMMVKDWTVDVGSRSRGTGGCYDPVIWVVTATIYIKELPRDYRVVENIARSVFK